MCSLQTVDRVTSYKSGSWSTFATVILNIPAIEMHGEHILQTKLDHSKTIKVTVLIHIPQYSRDSAERFDIWFVCVAFKLWL